MAFNEHLNNFIKEFEISSIKAIEIANNFKVAMEDGLIGKASSLKMLPSFIGKPSGDEEGVFYTVDMGGTNVRGAKFQIRNREFKNLDEVKSRLKDPDGKFNFTSKETTGEILFDFFANCVYQIMGEDNKGYLGHTFSFPSSQTGINEAKLIHWTKEIQVSGVEGRNPNTLLHEALKRKGINIEPVAIINDTVGTLLVAEYMYEDADIGVIMGTGHNACYLERKHPLTGKDMIVNMESGNFNVGLPITKYDRAIDEKSVIPGEQMLEKMVSGYYLGEVASLVVEDLYAQGALFKGNEKAINIIRKKGLEAQNVGSFITDIEKTINEYECSMEDAEVLRTIGETLVNRTARLIVSTLIGIMLHIDEGEIKNPHVVAIDGTIYEKMPKVPALMEAALTEFLKEKAELVSLKLVKDGSGLGAAIAAAVAVKSL